MAVLRPGRKTLLSPCTTKGSTAQVSYGAKVRWHRESPSPALPGDHPTLRVASGGPVRRTGGSPPRRLPLMRVLARALTTLPESARPPPFDLYRPNVPAGLSVVLDHAGVALRHPMLRAPFEISAAAVRGFRAHLDGEGFTEIHTPKIVGTDTESGANVFALDYFGRPAYLAQSPQFYKQTMVGVFERVYEVGPVFRAEPHDTARHLAQYTSLDVEVGFITDHHDVMAIP